MYAQNNDPRMPYNERILKRLHIDYHQITCLRSSRKFVESDLLWVAQESPIPIAHLQPY